MREVPMLLSVLFCFLGETAAMAQAEKIPTVGFVPKSFPRDPVDFNQFYEHMAIGQILEPLVAADRDGNVMPGVAESWQVSKDGRLVTFHLRQGQTFSNGKAVTADDVKYSLTRHIEVGTSQSKEYLKNIQAMIVAGPTEFRLELKEPQVAIFKILSRDQLGIVPKDWKFDAASLEPYVGTGAYTLKKVGDEWHFVRNDKARDKAQAQIAEWNLIRSDNPAAEMAQLTLPDYMPYLIGPIADAVFKDPRYRAGKYQERKQFHFTQSAAWWYPHGARFADAAVRHQIMGVMRNLVQKRRAQLGYEEITGIIPKGIAGSLPEPLKFPDVKPSGTKLVITVAGVARDIAEYLPPEEVQKVNAQYNVEIKPLTYSLVEAEKLKTQKPDVLLQTWAGGFADPEGFVAVITKILSVDFDAYLGKLAPEYHAARREQSWEKRAVAFRSFNQHLMEDQIMVPGWKTRVHSLLNEGFREETSQYRYTPRILDVKRK